MRGTASGWARAPDRARAHRFVAAVHRPGAPDVVRVALFRDDGATTWLDLDRGDAFDLAEALRDAVQQAALAERVAE